MQILFNGKTYDSLEEMPANERQAYEHLQQIFVDANGNGIPDFMEGDVAKKVMTAFTSVVSSDGKVYNNLDDLPPEAREKVQKAFDKLNQLGIITGKPSMLTSTTTETTTETTATTDRAYEPAFEPSKPLIQQESTTQAGGGTRWIVILGFLFILLVGAIAFAVFIYLR